MSKLKIDLHDCFNRSDEIEKRLAEAFAEALNYKAHSLEIIHGKGSGQLKKRVQRFLLQPAIKSCYKRVKNDPDNHGRLFVYF